MFVKICGIKKLADAIPAIEEGADYIGIILVPNRARTIDRDSALELSRYIHSLTEPRPKLVGVVRNQPFDDVVKLKHDLNLDLIQLHGSEPESWLTDLPGPVIRRLVPGTPSFTADVHKTVTDYKCVALVDSEAGGDGKVLDWSQLFGVSDCEFVLAGGLNPENVGQTRSVPGCIGVDVSGGVETNGIKDEAKIRAFIRNAKCS